VNCSEARGSQRATYMYWWRWWCDTCNNTVPKPISGAGVMWVAWAAWLMAVLMGVAAEVHVVKLRHAPPLLIPHGAHGVHPLLTQVSPLHCKTRVFRESRTTPTVC
jgi:hypothetical protein